DASTNAVLPGITVSVITVDTQTTIQSVQTDANGVYTTTSGLPAGSYLLQAIDNAGPYVGRLYNNIECAADCPLGSGNPLAVTAGHATTANFSLSQGVRFSGIVTDSTTGNSLSGVSVRVSTVIGDVNYGG